MMKLAQPEEIELGKDPKYGELNTTNGSPITYNKVTNVNVFNENARRADYDVNNSMRRFRRARYQQSK
jgi:hypothetical protein